MNDSENTGYIVTEVLALDPVTNDIWCASSDEQEFSTLEIEFDPEEEARLELKYMIEQGFDFLIDPGHSGCPPVRALLKCIVAVPNEEDWETDWLNMYQVLEFIKGE